MSNSYGGAGTDRSEKIALTNVRVFDGRELRGPTTVIIEGGIVGNEPAGARVIVPTRDFVQARRHGTGPFHRA